MMAAYFSTIESNVFVNAGYLNIWSGGSHKYLPVIPQGEYKNAKI